MNEQEITRTCRDCNAEYPFALNAHRFSWWAQLMFCPVCREKRAVQYRAIIQQAKAVKAKNPR